MKRYEVKSNKIPSEIPDVTLVVFDRYCEYFRRSRYNYPKPVTGL